MKSSKSVLELSARHGQTLCTVLQNVSVVEQHAVLSFTTTTDVETTCQHALCTESWSSFILTCDIHPCSHEAISTLT